MTVDSLCADGIFYLAILIGLTE